MWGFSPSIKQRFFDRYARNCLGCLSAWRTKPVVDTNPLRNQLRLMQGAEHRHNGIVVVERMRKLLMQVIGMLWSRAFNARCSG
jgi:hypothetical protein